MFKTGSRRESCYQRRLLLVCILYCLQMFTAASVGAGYPANYVAQPMVELNDNGAWSWFMDERAIVQDGKVIVGSVRAVRDFDSGKEDPDWGNVEVSVWDLATGETETCVLHRHLEQDDHDGPSFLALPDGRILAVYTEHGMETKVYYSHSAPNDPLTWDESQEFVTPGKAERYGGDSVTYSNLFFLRDGRIINFFRGFGLDPNYMTSADQGASWEYGGRMMRGRDGYSPYLKYAADDEGNIHFVATEDHPRNFDNSLYHGIIRGEDLLLSDGSRLGELNRGTEPKLATWDFTRVFQGDPDNVAWMVDIELDAERRPVILFSVQKDGRGLPVRQGGMDMRYCLARWDGKEWQWEEIAYAGTRLYAYEDDYSGLGAIDPANTDRVFISTDADPVTGAPLVSSADGKRHHELFEGRRNPDTGDWNWTPFTANSDADNLRPLIPKQADGKTVIVWMRGGYRHNHGSWTTKVVGALAPTE